MIFKKVFAQLMVAFLVGFGITTYYKNKEVILPDNLIVWITKNHPERLTPTLTDRTNPIMFYLSLRITDKMLHPYAAMVVELDYSGGRVDYAYSIARLLTTFKRPVIIRVRGKCFSSCLIMLSSVKYRVAGKHSDFMFHNQAFVEKYESYGRNHVYVLRTLRDLSKDFRGLYASNVFMFKYIAKNIGTSSKYFLKEIAKSKSGDVYLSPKEAHELNLVNILE